MNINYVDHRTDYETDIDMHIPINRTSLMDLQKLLIADIIHISWGRF